MDLNFIGSLVSECVSECVWMDLNFIGSMVSECEQVKSCWTYCRLFIFNSVHGLLFSAHVATAPVHFRFILCSWSWYLTETWVWTGSACEKVHDRLNDLMNMPPVALCSIDKSCLDMYYPKPLIQQWKECTQGICAENSGKKTANLVTCCHTVADYS